MNYKDTLNLPVTEFAMRANLPKREPGMIEKWEQDGIYEKLRERSKGKPMFILHDGPPYANGHLHIGHALNKILKDIIMRSRQMSGFDVPYVPGWDCHGLPIEHNVDKELGKKKSQMTPVQIRKECREYANKFIDIQRNEFKRFGVAGDWDNPYLTMNYPYEARIAKECGEFALSGDMFLGKKPIYWCCSCKTALAEAEVEYHDHGSPSVYVKFPVQDIQEFSSLIPQAQSQPLSVVIWTTTPWTLPANLAICLHPDLSYAAVQTKDDGIYILALDLVAQVMENFGMADYEILCKFKGRELENKHCRHPFYERDSLIILGNHVTLDAGTGCVHTAPGHGAEDHLIALQYGLDAYSPVEDNGVFSDDVEFFRGQFIFKANENIISFLQEKQMLVKRVDISHSYPHCWRCKNPLIYRATPQWFISMDKLGLREKALTEIDKVTWIPSWGRDRIYSMVENRPDWCLSRQRSWGIPIPVFHCRTCKEPYATRESVDKIHRLFTEYSSDIWFEKDAQFLMPQDAVCASCGGKDFEKDHNILDVWFDSGISHAAVLDEHPALSRPADLYLEGSDQHRGWFHSALLTAVGSIKKAPYKSVLTHGFVVDEKGMKMSKSIGNVVAPETVIEQYGADVLRLWVASSDYRGDVSISNNIIKQLSDAYRRIRNTCRFMLGNLHDFDPAVHAVDVSALTELDQFALHRLHALVERCLRAYDEYEFHIIYHGLHNFCVTDLSAFYLDIIKDRLYTSLAASQERRCTQTAMYIILDTLVRLMAPILPFTADEVYQHMPEKEAKEQSVHLTEMVSPRAEWKNSEIGDKWNTILSVRTEVTKALEEARKVKLIGHPLDASIAIQIADDKVRSVVENLPQPLNDIFIVSQAVLTDDAGENAFQSKEMEGLAIGVEKASGEKCGRCWRYDLTTGNDQEYPGTCKRCADVLHDMKP